MQDKPSLWREIDAWRDTKIFSWPREAAPVHCSLLSQSSLLTRRVAFVVAVPMVNIKNSTVRCKPNTPLSFTQHTWQVQLRVFKRTSVWKSCCLHFFPPEPVLQTFRLKTWVTRRETMALKAMWLLPKPVTSSHSIQKPWMRLWPELRPVKYRGM